MRPDQPDHARCAGSTFTGIPIPRVLLKAGSIAFEIFITRLRAVVLLCNDIFKW